MDTPLANAGTLLQYSGRYVCPEYCNEARHKHNSGTPRYNAISCDNKAQFRKTHVCHWKIVFTQLPPLHSFVRLIKTDMGRLVPWSSWAEWAETRLRLFSEDASDVRRGLHTVGLKLPCICAVAHVAHA